MAKEIKKLTEEELTLLQGLQREFNQVKLDLGNTLLQQHNLMKTVDVVKDKFQAEEKMLMEKYGADVTINLENGDVTEKEEAPLTKVEKE
tara:strand:+ start:315 stop:584 length:270 start_codon:yes stop_codon:yes gene_type:complete